MVRPRCGQSINGHVWPHTPKQQRRCGALSGFLRQGEMKASSPLAPVEISRYTGKPLADNQQMYFSRDEVIPNIIFLLIISSRMLAISLYLIPKTLRQIAPPPFHLASRLAIGRILLSM